MKIFQLSDENVATSVFCIFNTFDRFGSLLLFVNGSSGIYLHRLASLTAIEKEMWHPFEN